MNPWLDWTAYCGWPVVWIVTSTDFEGNISILTVMSDETKANDLVETLTEADTQKDYAYQAVKKVVIR